MKDKFKIYSAGPITGLDFKESTDWRNWVKEQLEPDIIAYSPLRQKDFLKNYGVIPATNVTGLFDHPLSTNHGIMTRDHFDCMTSDLILVNLLGAKIVSIGTCMEIAWAFSYRKPVVCIIEADNSNVHEHAMINEAINFRVDNLQDAVYLTKCILLGGIQ